jgi:hypothetical protein
MDWSRPFGMAMLAATRWAKTPKSGSRWAICPMFLRVRKITASIEATEPFMVFSNYGMKIVSRICRSGDALASCIFRVAKTRKS